MEGLEVKNVKLHDDIVEMLEKKGFKVGEVEKRGKDYYVEIQQHTPAGEDWHETFDYDGTNRDFFDAVMNANENFDVDEEVELWVDSRGKNGVPSSIRTLVRDAEWKKDKLAELVMALASLEAAWTD